MGVMVKPIDLFIEIDTRCNARCWNCDTGNGTRSPHRRSMDVDLFEKILDRALETGITDTSNTVYLFDRGEPTLHPRFGDIVEALNRRRLQYCISSNCGRVPKLDPSVSMAGLSKFVLSMPGFSQASYDKVHRLPFDKVVKNIETMLPDWRQRGFTGDAIMSMHVYRYNVDEIEPGRAFCERNGIIFSPYLAFFADYNMQKSFLTGTMAPDLLKRTEQDIFTDVLLAKAKTMPPDYSCQQQVDRLNISENGDVLLCCGAPRAGDDYEDAFRLGSFFDYSPAEIMAFKSSGRPCAGCIKSGSAFVGFDVIRPSEIPTQETPPEIAVPPAGLFQRMFHAVLGV